MKRSKMKCVKQDSGWAKRSSVILLISVLDSSITVMGLLFSETSSVRDDSRAFKRTLVS